MSRLQEILNQQLQLVHSAVRVVLSTQEKVQIHLCKDRFRIGRVKVFGEVWKSRLKQLSKKGLGTRAIARELGVDSKTVKKYLGRNEVVSNQAKIENKALLEQHRNELIGGIQKLPNLSRTALRECFKTIYVLISA